jgi:TonB family protein
MKRKTSQEIIFILAGLAVNVFIFLSLPLIKILFSDSLSHKKFTHISSVEMVKIKQPEKKENKKVKIKKIRPSREQKQRDLKNNRFKLDLGAASSGSGAAVNAGETKLIEYAEGETDTPPVPVNIVRPEYPYEAYENHIEGSVSVTILVDEKGKVQRVEYKSGMKDYGFFEAVRNAVFEWEFKPAMLNDIPVRCRAVQTLNFTL